MVTHTTHVNSDFDEGDRVEYFHSEDSSSTGTVAVVEWNANYDAFDYMVKWDDIPEKISGPYSPNDLAPLDT